MAQIESGASSDVLTVDPTTKAARVSIYPRLAGYSVSATTPTLNALLAAGVAIFAARLDPAAGASYKAYITRLKGEFINIGGSGGVAAGRELVCSRGSGAAAAAGTQIATASEKDSSGTASQFDSAQGGDMRFAPATGLTVVGITFETINVAVLMGLTGGLTGAAGTRVVETIEWDASQANPIILNQGELIAVRIGVVAFPATATWTFSVTMDWFEG